MTRGLFDQTPPPCSVFNSAYLGKAKAKFFGKLSPFSALFCPFFYNFSVCRRYFGCYALLSVLHCAVLSHVHLIIKVCVPSKVSNVVIRGISVVMTYIGLIWCRVFKKRKCHQSVGHETLYSAVWRSKYVCNISASGAAAAKDFWGIGEIRVWISPRA